MNNHDCAFGIGMLGIALGLIGAHIDSPEALDRALSITFITIGVLAALAGNAYLWLARPEQ